MRNFILSLVLFVCVNTTFAQAPLGKGNTQLNAGFGFSSYGLPIYAGLDYGVHPDVSLGVEASYRSYKERWDKNDYNHSLTGISGNVNYHFNRIMNIPRKWNFYAGLSIGVYIWSSPDGYKGSRSSGLGLGGQLGGRYFFSNSFGLNLEVGGGGGNNFSGGKFGITYKF